MSKKSNENELAFFFKFDQKTYDFLKSQERYLLLTQSEVNSTTKKGLRVTNRVRRTDYVGLGKETVFESATKYRLPLDENMISSSVELEKVITEDEFKMSLPFGESLFVKRRIEFEIAGYFAELDWYVEKESKDLGYFAKLDINVTSAGLTKEQKTYLLQSLPEIGITITDLINPPWVIDPAIGKRIGSLINDCWNLV